MVKRVFMLSLILIVCGSAEAEEIDKPFSSFLWFFGESSNVVESNSSVYEWYTGENNCFWGERATKLSFRSRLSDPCSWPILSKKQSSQYYWTLPRFESSYDLLSEPPESGGSCRSEGTYCYYWEGKLDNCERVAISYVYSSYSGRLDNIIVTIDCFQVNTDDNVGQKTKYDKITKGPYLVNFSYDDENLGISFEPGCSLYLYRGLLFRSLPNSTYGYPYGKLSCDLIFDDAMATATYNVNTEMIAFIGGSPPDGFHN